MTTAGTPSATGSAPALTPTVQVRLFAGAAAAFGADAATVHGATLAEALADLLRDASEEAARVVGRSSFLLNAVACTDHDRELADGDRLDVLPPFAGG